MSWRALRATRDLRQRRESGDQSIKNAVALTPQGSLFGVPNAAIALAYFVTMSLGATTGLVGKRPWRYPTLVAAWTSLAVSAYLVFQLIFVLHRRCSICMKAHTLNLALTLLLTVPASPERHRHR